MDVNEWDELRDRLAKAARELRAMANEEVKVRGDGWDEVRRQQRLHFLSKAEGLDLALGYMIEASAG